MKLSEARSSGITRKERRELRHGKDYKPSKFELILDAIVAAMSIISIFKKDDKDGE
jgi:hypothetical protein